MFELHCVCGLRDCSLKLTGYLLQLLKSGGGLLYLLPDRKEGSSSACLLHCNARGRLCIAAKHTIKHTLLVSSSADGPIRSPGRKSFPHY